MESVAQATNIKKGPTVCTAYENKTKQTQLMQKGAFVSLFWCFTTKLLKSAAVGGCDT